jgi:hypothetical protein
MASYNQFVSQVNLTGHGDAMQVRLNSVNDDFFTVLGVRPIVGRPLQSGDSEAPSPVAVLKEATWRRVFGADPRDCRPDDRARRRRLPDRRRAARQRRPRHARRRRVDSTRAAAQQHSPRLFLGVVRALEARRDAGRPANQELAAIMRGARARVPRQQSRRQRRGVSRFASN